MKLEEWGVIAEIVSGVAVLITLVVLIVGIRENTAITRVSVYGDILDAIGEIDRLTIADPELDRLISTLFEGSTETLTESQRRTVRTYLNALFKSYERAYFSREYDVIGDAEWERFERVICSNSRRAKQVGLEFVRDGGSLTSAFREYIATSCVDGNQ
jgi:hypothetical protein